MDLQKKDTPKVKKCVIEKEPKFNKNASLDRIFVNFNENFIQNKNNVNINCINNSNIYYNKGDNEKANKMQIHRL